MSRLELANKYRSPMGAAVRAYVVELHYAARNAEDFETAIKTGNDLYADTMAAFAQTARTARATKGFRHGRARTTAERLKGRLDFMAGDLNGLTLQDDFNKRKGGAN